MKISSVGSRMDQLDLELEESSAVFLNAEDLQGDEIKQAFSQFHRSLAKAMRSDEHPCGLDAGHPTANLLVKRLAEFVAAKPTFGSQVSEVVGYFKELDRQQSALTAAGKSASQNPHRRPSQKIDLSHSPCRRLPQRISQPGWCACLEHEDVLHVLEQAGIQNGWAGLRFPRFTGESSDESRFQSGHDSSGLISIPASDEHSSLVMVQSASLSADEELSDVQPEPENKQLCQDRDSDAEESWISSDQSEEDRKRIQMLYSLFTELCRLALMGESDDQHAHVMKHQSSELQNFLSTCLADSGLHFVFGGMVSSGKTTLVNSWFVNGLQGFPQDIELMAAEYFECTKAVSIFKLNPTSDVIRVCKEQSTYNQVDASTNKGSQTIRVLRSVADLKNDLPNLLADMSKQEGIVHRLTVEFPFAFAPYSQKAVHRQECLNFFSPLLSEFLPPSFGNRVRVFLEGKLRIGTLLSFDSPSSKWAISLDDEVRPIHVEQYDFSVIGEGISSKTLPFPTIVDTPGLDSAFVKHQLLSVLNEKLFIFCYLVDITSKNPFGKEGAEVFQWLAEHAQFPFPPVIVFTHWEKFQAQWLQKGFQQKVMKGKTAQEVAFDIMKNVLDKLKAEQPDSVPFSAAVNALDAMDVVYKPEDKEAELGATEAKKDLKKFMHNLNQLGVSVRTSLLTHKMLFSLTGCTRKVVNVVLRDCKEAKLLCNQDEVDLRKVFAEIKTKFSKSVDNYFEGVVWTQLGVSAFKPSSPFTRDDCAINNIIPIFTDLFKQYKEDNPKAQDQGAAIREIGSLAVLEIQNLILKNMNRFEKEALAALEVELGQRIKGKELLPKGDVDTGIKSTGEFFVAVGLLAGVGMGAGAFATTTGYFATAGALSATGFGVCAALPFLGIGFGMLCYNKFWRWEDCEKNCLKEVLRSLAAGVPDFKESLKRAFAQHVDNTLKQLLDHRIPTSARAESAQAATILHHCSEFQLEINERLQKILRRGADGHWLGGSEELKQIWMSALESVHGRPNL